MIASPASLNPTMHIGVSLDKGVFYTNDLIWSLQHLCVNYYGSAF